MRRRTTEEDSERTDGSGGRRLHGSVRAQSTVVAVVLLIGLTLTGAAAVVVLGSDAASQSKENANLENAELALSQVDTKASRVAAGSNNSEVLTVSRSSTGETRVEPDAGYINVTLENETTGEVKQVLLNESLGKIVYEESGETIAFQGGGVWRANGEGAVMVTRPDVHYRGDDRESPTATIPLTIIEGDSDTGHTLTLRDNGTELYYPVRGDENRSNPILSGRINMTVRSEYYVAWGDYLEQLTDGQAEYDHANEEVSIVLVSPRNRKSVSHGLFQTGSDVDLEIGGGGGATTDAYNSSVAPYEDQNTDNGTIKTAGSVYLGNSGEIRGDIVADGDVDVQASSARVTGNISYGGIRDIHKNADIDGWIAENGSVNSTPSIRAFVESRVDTYGNATINDNDAEDAIRNNSLYFNGSDEIRIESQSGEKTTYYVNDSVTLDGQKVVFDTSNGDIHLAVDEDFFVEGGANVTVEGDNAVRIYLLDDFEVTGNSDVFVPEDDATKMWVYGTPEMDVLIKGADSRFVGAIYAPSSTSAGTVTVTSNAHVYGGVVSGQATVDSGGAIHFDEALIGIQPLPEDETIPRVTHLHLSITRVTVEAD